MLGEEVLDDPVHEDVWAFLRFLPTEPLEKLPVYTEDDVDVPVQIEAAQLAARMTDLKASSPGSRPR